MEMCNISLLFCLLVVVSGIWAKAEDGSDLNLKSIFRTPKDFSKVNFDHFELLERNNFEDKTPAESTTDDVKAEESKAEDKASKSIANAQVMLRIGGEDIHDCNRVILHRTPYSSDHSVYSEPLPLHSNDIRYPSLPPHGAYPCLPPPPFNFPGSYYSPGHIPGFMTPSYQAVNNNAIPHEFTINLPETHSTQHRPDAEEHFLEVPKKDVVCTENTRPKVVIEKPSHCDNHVEEVEVVNTPQESCNNADQHVYSSNSESTEPTMVQTSSINENAPKVFNPECVTTNTIQATAVEPEPSPTKVAYAEVNLADIGKACFDTPKDNIATLLDQALVPLSCQRCSKTNPLLVSYPVVTHEGNVATIPQEEVVSECPTCSHDVFCESCNRERNPDIPYGHRFSKDVDSLFEIADNSPELYVPPNLYNEAPSENLIKIQPALPPLKLKTISTVVPTEAECQPEKEEVQIAPPCSETVETPCAKQEVIQESSPCSEATTVESTRHTKLVPVELPQVVEPQTKHEAEWCHQKTWEQPSQQAVTETVQHYSETIESPRATQEVVQVSNPCHESYGAQHIFRDIYNEPSEVPYHQPALPDHYHQGDIVHTLNPYTNYPYVQQTVEDNNPCHESSYMTQEIFQANNLQQEPEQAVFQSDSTPTTFTRPGSLTEVTFYPDEGSSSTTKFVQPGNSYQGYPCPVPTNVDHSITIQPVYKSFPTVSSGVSTYQDFLTKLYPRRNVIQTSNQYVHQSPCVQQVVEVGNSYNQAPYAAQEIVRTNYPGSEAMTVQPNYNQIATAQSRESYHYAPYATQEVVEASNPCSGSFTAQPVYSRVPAAQDESSYNQVPYTCQQVGETSSSNTYPGTVTIEPVYNKIPNVHVSNSYHQAPYTIQQVIQKRYPCHNTISIKPSYNKCPNMAERSSYNQAPCPTQVIQKRNSCPKSKNPVICVRNSYSQTPCATQQVCQTSHPRTEAYTTPSRYSNAHAAQVGTPYYQASSGAQQVYQSSGAHAVSTPAVYSHAPTVQVSNPYSQFSFGAQQACQSSEAHHESTATAPAAYSHLPTVQVSNPYTQVSYGVQQTSQPSYPCSQYGTQSGYYKPAAGATYQSYPSASQYASYSACPNSAHHGAQAGSASYTAPSYTAHHDTQASGASYAACPYTAYHGVQASGAYPQSTTPVYTTTEVNLEKPQVHYSGANSNSQYSVDYSKYYSEQPKVYADGYKTACSSSYYSSPLKSLLYKQPTVVDTFQPMNPAFAASYFGSYKSTPQTCHYSTPTYSTSDQQAQSVHPFLSLYGNYKASQPVTPAYQYPGYTSCVQQQPKVSQPHIYKIVGRYDHVPKDEIRALNIPDLVPTNQYLKVDRPACHGQHVPVDNVPMVRNEQPYTHGQGYGYGWPYWKSVPVQREVPLAPSYYHPVCSQCAKYRGELNQISCDR